MLVRREVLDRLGGFDQTFFMYSEETEFCLRVGDAGWRVVCEPTAVVEHLGGAMSEHPKLWALRAVNRVRLAARRASSGKAIGFRLTAIGFELRRVVTGDEVSRAALRALCRWNLDRVAVEPAESLGADTGPMRHAIGEHPTSQRSGPSALGRGSARQRNGPVPSGRARPGGRPSAGRRRTVPRTLAGEATAVVA